MTENIKHSLSVNQLSVIIGIFNPVIDIIVDRVSEKILHITEKKEPRYYTRQETADVLRITLPTLSRLTKDGILPNKQIGSRILYDAESIDEAVREKVIFKYRRAVK